MKSLRRIGIGFVLLFALFSLTKNIADYKKSEEFYASFRQEYEAAKKRQIELRTKIAKSKDLYEREKIIRNKLGKQKPGETTIIVPPPTPTPLPPTPTPNMLQRLFSIFK